MATRKSSILMTLACATICVAQEPLSVDPWELSKHKSAQLVIRAPVPSVPRIQTVELDVLVNTSGDVVSAKALRGPSELFAQAIAEVQSHSYTPFRRNGKAVAARFTDDVEIQPAERVPKIHRPFPTPRDWNSILITLQRTPCLGTCPYYKLEIHGNGTVTYKGLDYVAVPGDHTGSISRADLEALLDLFRKADYFSLDADYSLNGFDAPSQTVSLTIDGHSASVIDFFGVEAGMPQSAFDLEDAIDFYGGAFKWTIGDGDTVAALKREKFNFRSEEGGKLLAEVAKCGSAKAIRDLIAAGTPLDGKVPRDQWSAAFPALYWAAGNPDLEVLRLLIRAGASKNSPYEKNSARYRASSVLQRPEAVALLIKYGADK